MPSFRCCNHDARTVCRKAATLVMLCAVLVVGGCASNTIALRSVPKSPLVEQFDLASSSGPKASERTRQLLRVYNLSEEYGGDFRPLLTKLQAINDISPNAETVYAMSELAFLGGKKAEVHDKRAALDLYGASVLHAYDYLFAQKLSATRNPYDPNYRRACDLYNGALESALRIVCANKELKPGAIKTIETASGAWDIQCLPQCGRWKADDFERFEFVSDWQVNGLKNLYLTHGLGVPLIAVRRDTKNDALGEPGDEYYPARLSFPVTAFLRPISRAGPTDGSAVVHNQCSLELYDPLCSDATIVAGQRVPIESDLTTPLAYFLSRTELSNVATVGLLRPNDLLNPDKLLLSKLRPGGDGTAMGLYMVQPYEPGKIPVLMVHGLWSTPMTWLEMFNDLRSQPEIRDRYQFWFYLYPTAQPFWQSAAMLRRDLIKLRETLDPKHQEPALDQMVLIGHSMGGLVSRLQTISSGEDYWKLASNEPFPQIKADAETRQKLAETFFFLPNPSIRRVVTIGTPHHGSKFSRQTTQWLLEKLIRLPTTLLSSQQKLYRDNPDAFPERSLLRIERSIDSLSPKTPIFPVMLAGHQAPWVRYHNIVGCKAMPWYVQNIAGVGDGVVSSESAHVDDALSEITVPADHSSVHTHPAAVLEVRRILLEHLADLGVRRPAVAQRLPSVELYVR
jgi:pimeloyl-ACP methyl ester carboxylesterase